MGKYKRKTQRQSWAAQNMHQAVNEVLEGIYRLPSSLKFLVQLLKLESIEDNIGPLHTQNNTHTSEQEEELAQYILLMEARLFGFTLNDLRTLAFELAERNHLVHQNCQRWAHEACAGVDHDDDEEYSCDFCN